MSKRRIDLDPETPIASLLENVGLTAHALGVADARAQGLEDSAGARATVYAASKRGANVALAYLARVARAAGYRLKITIEKIDA